MSTTLIALALASSAPVSTTPYDFAHAFVLQLGTFEGLRKTAIADDDRDAGQSDKVMLDCIHAGTSYDLEVGSAISSIQGMHLRPKFHTDMDVPAQLVQIYRIRQGIMRRLTAICSTFTEGPKDGVDYKSLVAEAPKLRAQLEFVDQSLNEVAVFIFALLISDKPDAQGHASNLAISCAQRDELLRDIERSFTADELRMKNPRPEIFQAQVFHDKLNEFHCFPSGQQAR